MAVFSFRSRSLGNCLRHRLRVSTTSKRCFTRSCWFFEEESGVSSPKYDRVVPRPVHARPHPLLGKLYESFPRNRLQETVAEVSKTPSTSDGQVQAAEVGAFVDGQPFKFSAILLRDLCECPACVDPSTKQKSFSTAEIPLGIQSRAVAQTETGASILWDQDIPRYDRGHTTELTSDVLRSIAFSGLSDIQFNPGRQTVWDAEAFSQLQDIDYEAYMQDDSWLHKALEQLQSHGLMFLTNVPEDEISVSTIAERIGAVKNTFYGYTWDVRSVPQAKNVAYTSQDLGFHMDLLYMHQPPHLQFLHCIRSSSVGGASLFTDSYKSASDLFFGDVDAFLELAYKEVSFHYNHPSSQLYQQKRPVFEMKPMQLGQGQREESFASFVRALKGRTSKPQRNSAAQAFLKTMNVADHIDAVSWAPPFQGPFALTRPPLEPENGMTAAWALGRKVDKWHAAAREFNSLIHRPETMYERHMKPGECVLFDNRRVLHARRAFEVGDVGKERWLRGAYLDKDPYISKMQVLRRLLGNTAQNRKPEEFVKEQDYFEAAASS